MLEIYQRRNLILTEPNPGPRIDYVVTLQSNLTGDKDVFPARLTLRYVKPPLKTASRNGATRAFWIVWNVTDYPRSLAERIAMHPLRQRIA